MGANMRDRVAQRAQAAGGGQQNPAGGEVAVREPVSIIDHIRNMEREFQHAMPTGIEATMLVRDAITAVRTTRGLDQCDAPSVLGALMTCAQLGLRPGVMSQAWILPFWDGGRDNGPGKPKGGMRAQFIPGYQGLVQLAYRSPLVQKVIGRMVRDGERFEVKYGLDEDLVHEPMLEGLPGEATNYYVAIHTVNGGRLFYTMNRAEGEAYRERYAPRNKAKDIVGPWVSDFDSMVLKTCMRQLSKWAPKSTELAAAIENDGTVRVDLAPGALDQGGEHPQVLEGEVVADTAEPDGAQS